MSTLKDVVFQFQRCGTFNGIRYIESVQATEPAEDWSGCRSISRARRREAQGHRQRVRRYRAPAAYMIGDVLYIHPDLATRLRRETAERLSLAFDKAILREQRGDQNS